MGAVFAKVISTANNYLFSPATNLVNDVYTRFINKTATDKQVLLVSRLIVVGLGIWALLQGVQLESILQKALYAYTIYSAAITPVVMAAFFSKRVTAAGAVSSIAAGTFVTVFWEQFTKLLPATSWWAPRDAIVPALLASLFCLVIVSLFTRAPRHEQWAPFFAEEGATEKAVVVK
jgi:Na+/proline symporter